MKIWWRSNKGIVECVDTCAKKDAEWVVGQYQIAFKTGKVWAGLKRDEPND